MTDSNSGLPINRRAFLAQMSATGLLAFAPQAAFSAATDFPYKLVKTGIQIFPGDTRKDYTHFRIPSLTATPSGQLIAICQGRFWEKDHGDTDILMKTSQDGGRTWSEPHQTLVGTKGLFPGPTVTWRNPTLAYADGRLILILLVDEGGEPGRRIRAGKSTYTSRFFIMRSRNPEQEWSDRVKWSKPKELDLGYDFRFAMAGPGRGFVNNGRLIMPASTTNGQGRDSTARALLSDDMGKTWRVSGPAGKATETQIAVLSGDRLLMSKRHVTTQSFYVSKDNGETWKAFKQTGDILKTPQVQTGIITDKKGRVIISGPNNPEHRFDISLWISNDFGKVADWSDPYPLEPKNRCTTIEGCTNLHGYSCPALLPDGTLVVMYEDSNKKGRPYKRINCAILEPVG